MKTPYIVAELSANHLGSLERALAIVDAAADAGADGLKIQTWLKDTMCIDDSRTMWQGESVLLRDLYAEAYLPWEFHKPIFDRCAERGIECFSSPFDRESVDFLESLDCPRYKIASFELVDLPLIRYVASKGKPMIMSTGMATWQEIDSALMASRRPHGDVTLLKCSSAYPADASDANLKALRDMMTCFGEPVGLSDHSPGIGVAVAAVALGATMIEKHLTLSRADGGPDAGFSMEPHEFKQMVVECRRAAAAIGEVKYGPGPSESTALRRSLYITKDMKAGDILTAECLRTARPALGMAPSHYERVLGWAIKRDIMAGTPMTQDLLGHFDESTDFFNVDG
jgi:pseudaminic acid synthase